MNAEINGGFLVPEKIRNQLLKIGVGKHTMQITETTQWSIGMTQWSIKGDTMNGLGMVTTVGPKDLAEALKFNIINDFPTLIVGPPGVGKTYITKQVAKKLHADIEIFFASTSDPTEVKGFPSIKDGKADFTPYGQMYRLLKAKKLTICFLDDFGQASPAVQASWMNPIQQRELNGQKIPDCVRFVLATNRREDGANVHGVLEPIKSRMYSIIHVKPSIDDFLEWWIGQDLPFEIYAYLKSNPTRLHDFKPSKDIVNYPCPRTWEYAGRAMKAGVPKGLEMAILAGAIGDPDAMALLSFMEIIKDAIDPEVVYKNPLTAPIPDRTMVTFGLMAALIYKMNDKNFRNLLKYAKRLGPEFGTKVRYDALAKSHQQRFDITSCDEYGELLRATGNATI